MKNTTKQISWLSRNAQLALAAADRKAFDKLAYKFFRSPSAKRLNVTTVRKVLAQAA